MKRFLLSLFEATGFAGAVFQVGIALALVQLLVYAILLLKPWYSLELVVFALVGLAFVLVAVAAFSTRSEKPTARFPVKNEPR